MGYVKHDVSKAIKTVLNSASGGFREQAVDLKRVGRISRPSPERLDATLEFSYYFASGYCDTSCNMTATGGSWMSCATVGIDSTFVFLPSI